MKTNTTTTNTASLSIEFPNLPDTKSNRDPSKPSIRQIILTGLEQGKNTPSITAVIKQFHPNSMAAAKSSKHIAHYRALVKKQAKSV